MNLTLSNSFAKLPIEPNVLFSIFSIFYFRLFWLFFSNPHIIPQHYNFNIKTLTQCGTSLNLALPTTHIPPNANNNSPNTHDISSSSWSSPEEHTASWKTPSSICKKSLLSKPFSLKRSGAMPTGIPTSPKNKLCKSLSKTSLFHVLTKPPSRTWSLYSNVSPNTKQKRPFLPLPFIPNAKINFLSPISITCARLSSVARFKNFFSLKKNKILTKCSNTQPGIRICIKDLKLLQLLRENIWKM